MPLPHFRTTGRRPTARGRLLSPADRRAARRTVAVSGGVSAAFCWAMFGAQVAYAAGTGTPVAWGLALFAALVTAGTLAGVRALRDPSARTASRSPLRLGSWLVARAARPQLAAVEAFANGLDRAAATRAARGAAVRARERRVLTAVTVAGLAVVGAELLTAWLLAG